MTKQEYNGWTNYETWNLALWIDNEQGSYEYWRERAQEVYQDTKEGDDRKHDATVSLADQLKAETEEAAPEITGFYADVLGAAISEVNWFEIAEHWIEEAIEELAE